MKKDKTQFKNQNGAVMLEYALGAFLLCIPLAAVWCSLYNFSEGWTAQGLHFAVFFQKILTGISLPLP